MSEFLTDAVGVARSLTFGTHPFAQMPETGTPIAALAAFPPFNYRGMQARLRTHPPPGGTPDIADPDKRCMVNGVHRP